MSRPVVFADANVLYSAALRDILIELALADVIRLHWSADVLAEMAHALVATGRASLEGAGRLCAVMSNALPAAGVGPAVYSSGIVLPDPGDVHVLDAAHAAGCTILLTFNVADFPDAALAMLGELRAMQPDTFFSAMVAVDPQTLLAAIKKIRAALRRPAFTAAAYLEHIDRCGLPRTSAALAAHLESL